MKSWYAITINVCARCSKTHKKLRFRRLRNPSDSYEWWAPCPKTKQPILMRMTFQK